MIRFQGTANTLGLLFCGTMTASMSHEIKNALAIVNENAEQVAANSSVYKSSCYSTIHTAAEGHDHFAIADLFFQRGYRIGNKVG